MDALLLAVLNALWQGAALIALVTLTLRAGLRRNATTACVVWSITFVVVALLPALDLALARPPAAARVVHDTAFAQPAPVRRPANEHPSYFPLSAAPVLAADATFTRAPHPSVTVASWPASLAQRADDVAMRLGGVATAFVRSWGIVLVGAWALVAGTLLLRLARAYAAVARMKRDATMIDDPRILGRLRAAGHRRRATVAQSAAVEIPCAVGFRRPMILIPARLASSLDAEDLARVVLHESAHLQRYDDWINALEQIVCALQFFQPALYVARRSIDFEREVACDDRVLEDAGEPLRYAECLARIVQRHVRGRQAAVVPGFVLRRTQVVARVRRIVDRSRDASPHLRLGAAVLGGFVMLATIGIARLQVPVVAPASAMPASSSAPTPAKTLGVARLARHAEQSPHLRRTLPATAGNTRTAGTHKADTHTANNRTRTSQAMAANAVAAAKAGAKADAKRPVTIAAATGADPSPAPSDSPSPAPSPSPYVRVERVVHPLAHEHSGHVETVRSGRAYVVAPHAESSTGYSYSYQVAPVAAAVRAARSAASASAEIAFVAPRAVRSIVQTVAETAETPRAPAATIVLPKLRHTDGDLLDAIDEAKYPHPSIDELIALRNQGVSADYVRRMGALGRNRPSLHELLALATQGVTPDYVATLDARLASPPTLDQVLALRVQGVRASWLDGMAAIGYPKLSANDAVSLAVQGVSTSYVRGLLDAGLRSVTPSQLISLRTQGVDGTFVRRLADHGYRNLSIDELVRLKVSGFQP
jgi:beta-lactamase regulating signal transducer with metallopeptidase domain